MGDDLWRPQWVALRFRGWYARRLPVAGVIRAIHYGPFPDLLSCRAWCDAENAKSPASENPWRDKSTVVTTKLPPDDAGTPHTVRAE
jgi:hypothetical protein